MCLFACSIYGECNCFTEMEISSVERIFKSRNRLTLINDKTFGAVAIAAIKQL